MDGRALLAGPHLSVASAEPDRDLERIARAIGPVVTVDGPAALAAALGQLAEGASAPGAAGRTLDLIGHTRTADSLLSLGDWSIDGADPTTAAVFRDLAGRAVLARLGIHTLRLLGCHSAGTARGRDTIGRLAALTGIEVAGTRELLHAGHYGPGGFRDAWSFLLVRASELRAPTARTAAIGAPGPRVLELAALPASELADTAPCPRRIASEDAARRILALVRRDAGACMPGGPPPALELALPLPAPGAYHLAEVVLDGSFLRVYPDAARAEARKDAGAGIAFPIDDRDALHRIIAELPVAAPGPR